MSNQEKERLNLLISNKEDKIYFLLFVTIQVPTVFLLILLQFKKTNTYSSQYSVSNYRGPVIQRN